MRCKDVQESLATLAEGGSAPEAAAHAAGCVDCGARLAQLRRVVEASRLPTWNAPANLVASAKDLMRPRPRLVARLLGNGLATSGARRASSEAFSLSVGVGSVAIPLRFVPARGGWEVLGRAPSEAWVVVRDGVETPCGPSGRFQILATSLDETAFVLRLGADEIEVPSAGGLIDRAP